jgi:protein SCO1/2
MGLRVLTVWSLAAALALLLAGCGGSRKPAASFPASPYAGASWPGPSPPSFALRDQAGKLVRLSSLRGKFVVVTFLYTHCPDVCPLIAAQLNQVLRSLGARRGGVRVLAVSVDPKGDTPRAVRQFVRSRRLLPEFRYLTGTRAQLAPVWKSWHVAVGANLSRTYSFHSAYELLLDRSGKARLLYSSDVKARDVLHDLRLLGLQ